MNGKNAGLFAVLAAVLAAGGFFAWKKGAFGGSGVDTASEGSAGSAASGAGRRGKGTTNGGPREGTDVADGDASADAAPAPDFGTYAYALRTARTELEMAKADLENYKDKARWPESARPAEEMAPGGGLLPHYTSPTNVPLVRRRADGTADPDSFGKARVLLAQDRFQMVGDDAVTVTVKALGDKNRELSVRCSEAHALPSGPPNEGAPAPFAFGCKPGKDGGVVATFVPKQSPYRAYTGSIDLDFDLSLEREDGVQESGNARVVVHYVPQSPGRLTGVVREAYEGGSIAYYLGFEAAAPGFYWLNVRADNGSDEKVFAHINVRQQIDKAGPAELRAELFGKLIVDNQVKAVRLRDIDGEFVPEAGEIASIPGKDGVFYVGKPVDASKVKGDDWQSPEKDEHMKHYEETLKRAQTECDSKFDGCKPN